MDSIVLKDLTVSCILGCRPDERTRRRLVRFHIELFLDLQKAMESDDLTQTLDYGDLVRKITTFAEGSSYNLIESLAYAVTKLCFENPLVKRVELRVFKPLPCPALADAAVKIARNRSDMQ